MWLRKILIVAAVAAPLALNPVDVFAQGRGSERSAAAHGQAAFEGHDAGRRSGPTITQLPPGIERVFAGRELPPGLGRRYAPPAPEADQPAPDTGTDTGTDTGSDPVPCATTVVMIGGVFYAQDCNGNLFPL